MNVWKEGLFTQKRIRPRTLERILERFPYLGRVGGESDYRVETELRMSPKLVAILVIVLAIVLVVVAEHQSEISRYMALSNIALLLAALSLGVLALDSWKPSVARWFATMGLTATICVASSWLRIPGFVTLLVVPPALAAALISPPAATGFAVGESILMVVLLRYWPAALDSAGAVVALTATWAVLGIMHAVYRTVHQLSRWLEEYFGRAQALLNEARDRRAELRQALERLANANRQLALANERTAALRMIAEEAQKEKTAFVANVSHEFRTPLNMIIGLIDLIVETPETYDVLLSPRMEQDLRIVHRNCEHLAEMINDVLALSQMDIGGLALYREPVDLKEIVGESVEAVRPLVQEKQLGLEVMLPEDLPQVYCDRTRIRQVILNLVSNAARFTEDGGITIEAVPRDQHVLISVTDTGPGIPAEDVEMIFEPFYRDSRPLLRQKGGSGLGLSISKRFIKLHGGQMWLESELGAGAAFFFTLPVSPPLDHPARPGHWIKQDWVWRERAFRTDQEVSSDQLVKPRVVICDETNVLYPTFRCYSDKIDFVDTKSLSQASDELERCPAHALVLNTAAPEDLCSSVQLATQQLPDTPIIGCSVPRLAQPAIDAGALGHLTKPVARADLEQVLRSVGKPVKRVLVVDDDPDALDLFSRILQLCGVEVATASNGQHALDELRRAPPDLMLLDIVMPDMNGWQVLEAMGHDHGVSDVPTVFVSAQDPADQLPASRLVLATMGEGVSIRKLLRCSLQLSMLLLKPEGELDPMPV
jgi:signal transduction histidine kinase/CheY-like chemotaxis protein